MHNPRPPVLLLGTSERVGSNWALDSLRHATVQRNEPVRQQLGHDHPLSPLHLGKGEDHGLGSPLAEHWVRCFVQGKKTGGRHVIKETNLYFATAPLLRLFSDAPVVVLSRSPLGVVGSFARTGLWERWGYDGLYRRITAMTQEKGRCHWAPLVPDDDPPPPVALARLIVMNAALLAEALGDRHHHHLPYEAAVLGREAALVPLRRLLPEIGSVAGDTRASAAPTVDSTFSTITPKNELVVHLAPSSADLVLAETTRCVAVVKDMVSKQNADRVDRWLAGADSYRCEPSALTPPKSVQARTASYSALPPLPRCYVQAEPSGITWRNTLVANKDMCALLNALNKAGLRNTYGGVHLMVIPMAHQRGGRLHPAPDGSWSVSPGFEDHPAYWVTWMGAAAYARWEGARLPTQEEMNALTTGARVTNCEYQVGDVVPVGEPGVPCASVHHRVGNLQVWCADGPAEPEWAPVSRYLHGAAWNTPGSQEEVARRRSRTLLGASRGVGVRLVREVSWCPPRSAHDIADRLRPWISLLEERKRSLSELDQAVVEALSQSDG
jgi:hypothetical protein